MDKDLAKEVYIDNPRVIMCGGGGPGGGIPRAEKQEDGSVKAFLNVKLPTIGPGLEVDFVLKFDK